MVTLDQPASRFPINTESLRRFLQRAQRATGVSGEVNVIITSNQRMRSLNREFRGKDKTTDVLSFPAAKPATSRNGKQSIAGDIAISAEIAHDNAQSLGHSLDDELRILLLHGLLHLAGYDHETDNGEMAKLEQNLRAKLKLPTGLIERTNGSRRKAVVHPAQGEPSALGRVFRAAVHARRNGKRALKSTVKSVDSRKATNGITPIEGSAKPPAEGGRFSLRSGRTRAARSPQ